MPAAATDKFKKVGNPGTATTLSAPGYTVGATSLTVASTTNYPTDTGVCVSMYEVTTVGTQTVMTPGSYNEYNGVVSGATSITSLSHVAGSGTDRNYAAGTGTVVTIMVSSGRENDLIDGLLVSHNQDGTLKASALIAAIYPVGSIYINATDATNPATLLGFGTWAAFGAGRVMVGKNTSGTFQTIGATGGEETHVLTTAEMPSHTHNMYFGSGSEYIVSNPSPTGTHTGAGYGGYMAPAGGDGAHNNLQPYIVVYMWRRTA